MPLPVIASITGYCQGCDLGPGLTGVLIIMYVVIPLIFIMDIVFCYAVARAVGLGKIGSLLTALSVGGSCAGVVMLISPSPGIWLLILVISVILAWAVAVLANAVARMGVKDDDASLDSSG